MTWSSFVLEIMYLNSSNKSNYLNSFEFYFKLIFFLNKYFLHYHLVNFISWHVGKWHYICIHCISIWNSISGKGWTWTVCTDIGCKFSHLCLNNIAGFKKHFMINVSLIAALLYFQVRHLKAKCEKKNCSLYRKYNEEANLAAVLLIFYVNPLNIVLSLHPC